MSYLFYLFHPLTIVAVLVVAWIFFTYHALAKVRCRHPSVIGVIALLGLRIAITSLAFIPAFSTTFANWFGVGPDDKSLANFGCKLGLYGVMLSTVFILVEARMLWSTSKPWPRSVEGKKDRFGTWIIYWLVACLFSLLVFIALVAACAMFGPA